MTTRLIGRDDVTGKTVLSIQLKFDDDNGYTIIRFSDGTKCVIKSKVACTHEDYSCCIYDCGFVKQQFLDDKNCEIDADTQYAWGIATGDEHTVLREQEDAEAYKKRMEEQKDKLGPGLDAYLKNKDAFKDLEKVARYLKLHSVEVNSMYIIPPVKYENVPEFIGYHDQSTKLFYLTQQGKMISCHENESDMQTKAVDLAVPNGIVVHSGDRSELMGFYDLSSGIKNDIIKAIIVPDGNSA